MTIFPYVYPYLDQDEFIAQADVVVGLFLTLFLLTLAIATIIAIVQLIKRPKRHPIFQDQISTVEDKEKEDLRNMWLEGKPKSKEEPAEKQPGEITNPGEIESLNNEQSISSGSEESSEPTEEETESETSNDNEGNTDEYAALRSIPGADVNLKATETGFGTGMSGLREAQIQKYRQQEKQMV
jgi:hypothetical protein